MRLKRPVDALDLWGTMANLWDGLGASLRQDKTEDND